MKYKVKWKKPSETIIDTDDLNMTDDEFLSFTKIERTNMLHELIDPIRDDFILEIGSIDES